MTEETDERRRRRRAGLLLGLLALLISAIAVVFATLAPAAGTPPLRINATPTTAVLTAGDSATYQLTLSRGSERGAVAFTTADLPPAASASFSAASTTGNASTLTITTDGDNRDGTITPAGTYDVVVRATGPDAVAGTLIRIKVSDRTIAGTNGLIQVGGSLGTVLRPGVGSGIDLSLTNPNKSAVRVSAVSTILSGLTAPRATASRPCTLADFEIVTYSGPAFTLTPGQTTTLSQLKIPAAQWPVVRMRNTSLNQDGCQGATVTFTYDTEGRTA